MQIYNGKSVFGGIAIGKISVYQKKEQQVKRVKIDDPEQEMARYEKAKAEGIKQLQGLYDKALREVGEANAAIFEVHQMMMEDDGYNESVENIIRSQGVNAEYAVATTGDNYAQMFSAMDDDYMKARSADIHDISDRLVSILSGRKQKSAKDFATGANKIICTEDFLPSEIIQFCENNAQGFLTAFGSSDSHSAILAKSLDIPVIVGLGWDLLNDVRTGDSLTVDGREGTVILNEKSESFVS